MILKLYLRCIIFAYRRSRPQKTIDFSINLITKYYDWNEFECDHTCKACLYHETTAGNVALCRLELSIDLDRKCLSLRMCVAEKRGHKHSRDDDDGSFPGWRSVQQVGKSSAASGYFWYRSGKLWAYIFMELWKRFFVSNSSCVRYWISFAFCYLVLMRGTLSLIRQSFLFFTEIVAEIPLTSSKYISSAP